MAEERLEKEELVALIKSVFPDTPLGGGLVVFCDVPDKQTPDHPIWKARRQLAFDWVKILRENKHRFGMDQVELVAYPNVGSNNADFPAEAYFWNEDQPPHSVDDLLRSGREIAFENLFHTVRLALAPTEFSTTAPLKVSSALHGFRAATMPGFNVTMIPALRIDYEEVQKRVAFIKEELDPAEWARIAFSVDGKATFRLEVDLRYRLAHASGGCFPRNGEAGNLPSGETYIVPYEGETGVPSRTNGVFPVQHGEDVVYYEVEANRVVRIHGEGEGAEKEIALLAKEPAYGNIAELGFGVLGDFGLDPIGQILLDEKLGFHLAFGRSDHFGGAVGPADFNSPKAVIHIDRIYIPSTQPRIEVKEVMLIGKDGKTSVLMKENRYTCF